MARTYSRYLILEASIRTPDGAGGFDRVWTAQGGFWGDIKLRSGALRHGDFGRLPRLQVRITTHVVPEGSSRRPAPGDRVRDGARVYEVEAVHDETQRQLVILASEQPGEGGDQ